MTDPELQQLRREKWRLDGKPIRTIEEARVFVEDNGFCLMHPQRPAVLLPTFAGAFAGSDENLPQWQHAFKNPRTPEATEMMVRLLREKTAFEANIFEENNGLLISASIFPYFYALNGERNPKLAPKPGSRSAYSALSCDVYSLIERHGGPLSKRKIQDTVGGSISAPALDKALGELWSKLRITRVDYNADDGSVWDLLYRWAPETVKEGIGLSVPEALTALLSRYLYCVVAAEQADLETFLGNFIARSKIRDAVNALLAARELSLVHVSGQSMLEITPEKITVVPGPRPPAVRKEHPTSAVPSVANDRPESKRSENEQPKSNRPEKRRPDDRRPDNRRPDDRRPDNRRPDNRRPDSRRPENRRPDNRRPDNRRPDSRRPDDRRPDDRRPDNRRPDSRRPDNRRPDNRRPDNRRPDNERPDNRRPDNRRPDNRRPDKRRPDSRRPDNRTARGPKPRVQPASPGTDKTSNPDIE